MVPQGDAHLHPDFKKQPKVVEVRIIFSYHAGHLDFEAALDDYSALVICFQMLT
jgi:hypothetical protein